MKKVKITAKNYHPIGSFFITENSLSPSSLFGGTWERLPEGYALWTATSGAGGTIAAGLPNIEGQIAVGSTEMFSSGANTPEPNGAFRLTETTTYQNVTTYTQGRWANNGFTFKASRSNSIYGNSNTVQPPAYKAYVWKRVA